MKVPVEQQEKFTTQAEGDTSAAEKCMKRCKGIWG